jgi:hypothetical protein
MLALLTGHKANIEMLLDRLKKGVVASMFEYRAGKSL